MAIVMSSNGGDYVSEPCGVTDQYGNTYSYASGGVIPMAGTCYTYTLNNSSGTVYAGGGGGGGSYVAPSVTIAPSAPWTAPASPRFPPIDANGNVILDGTEGMEWVPKRMKINKKILSSADIDKLIKQACLTVSKDDVLVISVDPGTSNTQMQELARQFNEYCKAIVMASPEIMVKTEGRPRDENERIDILARLGLIWETNPNMRLGELIAVIMGEKKESLMDIDDYPLITALEIAYKKEKNDKPNQP